jgi:uncharacterized membrane protein
MKTRFASNTTTKRRAARITQPSLKSGEGVKIEKEININRSPEVLYGFWRHFENLPRFMSHIESVTERGAGTSHWVMRTSQGKELEWDARIIEDRPNEMISWQSLENADVDNAGSVWFSPSRRGGTTVKVSLKYSPPGGKLGAFLAKITGQSAEKQIEHDLLEFKKMMESSSGGSSGQTTAPQTLVE